MPEILNRQTTSLSLDYADLLRFTRFIGEKTLSLSLLADTLKATEPGDQVGAGKDHRQGNEPARPGRTADLGLNSS
jgi:hypothetical protein